MDTLVSLINVGPNSSPAIGYLNNDTIPDMIIGNGRGGLTFFYGSEDNSISVTENTAPSFTIYPNPVTQVLKIRSEADIDSFEIIDTFGRLVQSDIFKGDINTSTL